MCGAGLRTRGRGAAPEEDGDLGTREQRQCRRDPGTGRVGRVGRVTAAALQARRGPWPCSGRETRWHLSPSELLPAAPTWWPRHLFTLVACLFLLILLLPEIGWEVPDQVELCEEQ